MTGQSYEAQPARQQARVCAECGTHAGPDQSFCDGCGAVLGWGPSSPAGPARGADTGDSVPAAAPPAADPGPPAGSASAGAGPAGAGGTVPRPAAAAGYLAEGARAGQPDRAEEKPDTAPGAAAPAGHPYADPGTGTSPEADTLQRPPVAEPLPEQGNSAAEERARALLIPVADPQQRPPTAPSVGAVMPGRPAAARPLVRAPGGLPDDDGPLACPWCGTGNRTDRHFCRRCAMPMAGRPEDDPARRRPWWRRLLDFRRREAPWAGDRPRLRRNLGRVVTWVAGAGAAVLVVVGATHIDDGVHATQDHFAKRAPVVPDSVTASRSFKGHSPKLAFDEFNNTWWGPGISESGAGQWLEARFVEPVHLLNLVITPGESTQPGDLSKSAEPHQLDVTVTTSDGRTEVRHVTLDQGSGGQTVSFRATKVTSVRFTVRSSYAAASNKQVAIAEVEFFGPKHSGG